MPKIGLAKKNNKNNFEVAIFSDFEPIVEDIKKYVLPENRTYDSRKRLWIINGKDPHAVFELMVLCKKHNIAITKEAVELAKKVAQTFADNFYLSSATKFSEKVLPKIKSTPHEIFDYQLVAMDYLYRNPCCILADTMGLGKTIEVLSHIDTQDLYPFLYVCPASLKINVYREILKWTRIEKEDICIVNGTKSITFDWHKAFIINYKILQNHIFSLRRLGFKVVVFDESHLLKNHKTQRWRAAYALAQEIPSRILMTGTPIENRPQELIPQLQIIGMVKNSWQFLQTFCDAKQIMIPKKGQKGLHKVWDFSGSSNEIILNRKLRGTCFIRRKRDAVSNSGLSRVQNNVYLEINNKDRYSHAEQEFLDYVFETAKWDKDFLGTIQSLTDKQKQAQQLSHALEKVEKAERAQHLVKIEALKQVIVEGKMSAVKDWVQAFIDNDEKIVIFLLHKRPLEELSAHFDAPAVYGATTAKKSQEAIDKFQNDDSCKTIFMNIKSGSLGHTLTAARFLAFVEFDWVPTIHAQAECRIDRIGQKRDMTFYYLIGANTIDEDIVELLNQKRKVVDMVTDGKIDVDLDIQKELMEKMLTRKLE